MDGLISHPTFLVSFNVPFLSEMCRITKAKHHFMLTLTIGLHHRALCPPPQGWRSLRTLWPQSPSRSTPKRSRSQNNDSLTNEPPSHLQQSSLTPRERIMKREVRPVVQKDPHCLLEQGYAVTQRESAKAWHPHCSTAHTSHPIWTRWKRSSLCLAKVYRGFKLRNTLGKQHVDRTEGGGKWQYWRIDWRSSADRKLRCR